MEWPINFSDPITVFRPSIRELCFLMLLLDTANVGRTEEQGISNIKFQHSLSSYMTQHKI